MAGVRRLRLGCYMRAGVSAWKKCFCGVGGEMMDDPALVTWSVDELKADILQVELYFVALHNSYCIVGT